MSIIVLVYQGKWKKWMREDISETCRGLAQSRSFTASSFLPIIYVWILIHLVSSYTNVSSLRKPPKYSKFPSKQQSSQVKWYICTQINFATGFCVTVVGNKKIMGKAQDPWCWISLHSEEEADQWQECWEWEMGVGEKGVLHCGLGSGRQVNLRIFWEVYTIPSQHHQSHPVEESLSCFSSSIWFMYVHAKPLQSCLIFCDPMECSPPGSSVHGILQTRILERVAMPSFDLCIAHFKTFRHEAIPDSNV